jgi:TolB-like protein
VAPSEAVAAVARVLDSRTFARTPRLREFLAFVTAETIAGRGEVLTERIVARRALRRGDTFDGRDDAVVRVTATRVRQRLNAYYVGEGRNDRLRIDLPVGPGYAASFHPVAAAAESRRALPADASVAVVLFTTDDAGDSSANVISAILARQLARVPGIRVVGPAYRRAADVGELAGDLGVRFVLGQTTVRVGRRSDVTLQLTDGRDGSLVWSVRARVEPETEAGISALDAWAAEIAAELGDFAGVILRHIDEPDAGRETEHVARSAFYRHIAVGHEESLTEAVRALDAAVDAGSGTPDILAMQAFAHGVLVWNQLSPAPDLDLAVAESAARGSLRREPDSALAYLTLGLVAAVRRQWEISTAHATHATALQPDHPSTLFTAGALVAAGGDWAGGATLMRRSFDLNPLHPGYQHANLAIERLVARDLPGALAEASIVDDGAGIWGPLCRALALAGLGYEDQARVEMRQALEYRPALLAELDDFLSDMVFSDEQLRAMHELVRPFAPGGPCDPDGNGPAASWPACHGEGDGNSGRTSR